VMLDAEGNSLGDGHFGHGGHGKRGGGEREWEWGEGKGQRVKGSGAGDYRVPSNRASTAVPAP
jgi:hypothetical protein